MTDAGSTLLGQLRRAGSLSAQQIDYLREKGFLPTKSEDQKDEDQSGWDDGVSNQPEEEDQTERLGGTGKRRGGRKSREPDLKADLLATELDELYQARLGLLEAIVPLADVAEKTPIVAMRWLRRQKAPDLAVSLRSLLSGSLTVEKLWNVLALDEFDSVGRDAPGPAPMSFRALVAAARNGQADPPLNYAWLLREPMVAAVYDLLVTQRRLIEAVGLVHERDPVLLRDGLRRRPHGLAFWTLTLLFNADLEAGRVGKGSGTLQAVTGRPELAIWTRAWGQALLMNERGVLPLLASLHSGNGGKEGEAVGVPLFAPAAWAKMVYRYAV